MRALSASPFLLLQSLVTGGAFAFHPVARHEGHDSTDTASAAAAAASTTDSVDHDHGGSAGHDAQGTGHGHSMSHGAFNFTPSGVPWPQCLRDCCNMFFEYFPEPVNHPLCVSEDFYHNVTKCVAEDCTAFEQGAFSVVVEIECPKGQGYIVDVDKAAVVDDLKQLNGEPQDCAAVNNATINCNNGSASDSGNSTGAGMAPISSIGGLANIIGTSIVVYIFSSIL